MNNLKNIFKNMKPMTKVILFPISILVLAIIFTPFVFNHFSSGKNPDIPMLLYIFGVFSLTILSMYIAPNIIFGSWKRKIQKWRKK